MATRKEAIAIILDVGPSMNQAPPGTVTALESAIEGINMVLQRKIFSKSKDEVSLIAFGTGGTDNPLDDGESYQNITLLRPLGVADFELLQMVQTDLQPSDVAGDFLDAIEVALNHLEKGLQGKKGFETQRLILFTDLGGEFGDKELDTIVGAMNHTKTELNVIGPNLDDDGDGSGDDAGPSNRGAGPSVRKEKTRQKRSGEALIRRMLDQVPGECFSFSEVLPALSYIQSRQIKQTAWKCKLEIGGMEIPIEGYFKIKEITLEWKKVYAQDTDVAPVYKRTYHMLNEEETEVEEEDMVDGYRYGDSLVPINKADEDSMKYKAEKCFKVLAFTDEKNFKRQQVLGNGVLSVTAEKGDEAAAVALSALIRALYETKTVGIAIRVYAANSGPRIGALFPHIKAKYECLFWVELPFSEDTRTFTFGSLPLTDDVVVNKKYKPTDEQLKCVDDLITSMDLSQALEDEDGEKKEALKPKITFNPYFQRCYQCLQHRALHPDDALPGCSPLIAGSLQPPPGVINSSVPVVAQLKKFFKLEVQEKAKKDDKKGKNIFQGGDADADEPQVKKQKLDNDLEGGLQGMVKAEVTEVGTVTPVDDFKSLLSRKDKDLFEEACQQMQKRIQQVVTDSFGQQFYPKALECLKVLRLKCIEKAGPNTYNDFLRTFKDTLIGKGRRDFWDQVVKESQGLISKLESEDSKVTKQEADEFTSGEVKVEGSEKAAEDEESADDLLDQL